MTKKNDELRFDFSGTSPQTDTDHNSTLPSTVAHLALALTNTLFWDVPWSDGKMRPVKINVPEGSILNCKYPAACGAGPRIGNVLVSTVCEAVAKMVYASGRYEDVNASTTGNLEFVGGPGYFYGGHTREGIPVAQGLYDIHGAGMGAAPHRDGVNTGGHMNIPSASITDIERIEMQYPFLYFTRSHNPDGSGFGRYRGGLGSYRIYLIYSSKDCSVDYKPYGGVAQGGFGLCGGYPTGVGATRVMIQAGLEMLDRVRKGEHPTGRAMRAGEWGKSFLPAGVPERVPLPEGSLLVDYVAGGGGFEALLGGEAFAGEAAAARLGGSGDGCAGFGLGAPGEDELLDVLLQRFGFALDVAVFAAAAVGAVAAGGSAGVEGGAAHAAQGGAGEQVPAVP